METRRVVIVEGSVTARTIDSALVAVYDAKSRWTCDADGYGPLTSFRAEVVLA
jgi:hypothetical protein